ncbi:MAG: orotidine-5'-phosphate decarboxylase [Chloroflexi bacterium]|nr:orotidine-5'-phosphate decarboxylase [Chloroflexota bacterium]
MRIIEKYHQRVRQSESLLCVGLDSGLERIPAHFRDELTPQFSFNRWLIEQTHAYACAFKLNLAFYEARGDQGWRELKLTMNYLQENCVDILTIGDAKRADIGSTNDGYVTALFDWLGFDAVTLNPYLGGAALRPFLSRADRAAIILCHTSNPGADEFQGALIDGQPLWYHVANRVQAHWNDNQNCMLVVGATQPDVLRQVRARVGSMPILVPGIGVQGGELAAVLHNGLDTAGAGLIINASRAIILSPDPGSTARDMRDTINQIRWGKTDGNTT